MTPNPDARLTHLAALEEGWDGYGAAPVDPRALDTASYATWCPGPNGDLQWEIHAGGVEIEIYIEPDGRISGVWVSDPALVDSD